MNHFLKVNFSEHLAAPWAILKPFVWTDLIRLKNQTDRSVADNLVIAYDVIAVFQSSAIANKVSISSSMNSSISLAPFVSGMTTMPLAENDSPDSTNSTLDLVR